MNGRNEWSPAEDAELLRCRAASIPYKSIAKRLGRSAAACAQRVYGLSKAEAGSEAEVYVTMDDIAALVRDSAAALTEIRSLKADLAKLMAVWS